MHAVLLTVLALAGGDGGYPIADQQVAPAGYHGGCDACGGHGHYKQPHGMMPQTCYNPKFGCYGADRQMHRYPAFHGTFYRRPYNYRNVFDYPWHAELHEPTSFFSYHVQGQTAPHPAASVPPVPDTVQHPYSPIPLQANASQNSIAPGLRTLRR